MTMQYFKYANIFYRINNNNIFEFWGHHSQIWKKSKVKSRMDSPNLKKLIPKLHSCSFCSNTGCIKCKNTPFSVHNKFKS